MTALDRDLAGGLVEVARWRGTHHHTNDSDRLVLDLEDDQIEPQKTSPPTAVAAGQQGLL